jgi:signal transduction histidine kinase
VVLRGLKSNVWINMLLMVCAGMILINMVTVLTLQRDLIRAEIEKGRLLLSMSHKSPAQPDRPLTSRVSSASLFRNADLHCSVVVDLQGDPIFSTGPDSVEKKELIYQLRSTIYSGEPHVRFSGETWGVFWMQSRFLLISEPLRQGSTTMGAAGIVTDLSVLYQKQRRSQKLFFIFIAVNTLILTFIGVYRISKIYFEPLHRLAQKADDYREEDASIFVVRKEDNELQQLSTALNRMVNRIAADKQKLRSTVLSLEKANLDLQRAQHEVIQAEKLASVGRLSAGIAHEIGNPIGIVIGYLDLLKQSDLPAEEKGEYIRRTENEINRINTIIRQLLDLSRPSVEGFGPVHLHRLLEELIAVIRYQPMVSTLNIDLCLHATDDRVWVDANQLRQVFLNLILNAADAMAAAGKSDGGRLKIASAVVQEPGNEGNGEPSPWLQVEVIDNGAGISPDHLGNIFDPFFTTKEPGKGTGLGLSVCFMIIERFGGRIMADSTVEQGTTLTVLLPLDVDRPSGNVTDASQKPDIADLRLIDGSDSSA